MPRTVKTPDGVVHQFPDDATDQEISTALGAPPAKARLTPDGKTRSWVDIGVDLLPTVGGIAGGLIGGAGGTVAGMGVGGVPGAIGGATLGGAAGEGLKDAVNYLRGSSETPNTKGQAIGGLVKQAAIQGGGEAIGAGVAAGAPKLARAVYRGYLKPSLAAKNVGKAEQIVQTALDEGLPLTKGGEGTAQRVIGELRQKVDDILANTSGTLNLQDVADKVRAFARERYFKPGADPSDYKAALAVADRIDSHPSMTLPAGVEGPIDPNVTLSGANATKRALQDSAAGSYGQPNASAVSRAEKVGARTLRQGIEQGAPDVAPLNAREAKLIDAARAIKQAVAREGNQNKINGIKALVAGGYGAEQYSRGDSAPEAIAKGLAARAVMSPATQSLAAIVANRIGTQLGVGASTAARLAAYVLQEQGNHVAPDNGQGD